VVLSADLSKYTDVLPFAEQFPDRFLQMGMAEQNMMGVAGGLAKSGFTPIAVTYGVFATRRAGEQIQMALSTGQSNTAVVVAFLPGITTPFTATHQATDDLAIMRNVPGVTVIDPADATDMTMSIRAAVEVPGPVYLRGLRGTVKQIIEPERYSFEIGQVYELKSGSDVGLIGTGLGTEWALEASDLLARDGIDASVLHVPTIKPLDGDAIARYASRFPLIVTVENHSVIGALGSAVSEVLAERGMGTVLQRLGVPDQWADAGPLDYIRSCLQLDAEGLARAVSDSITRWRSA
jgi:transketolase